MEVARYRLWAPDTTQPIRSTTQIWLVYASTAWNSALALRTSIILRETSGRGAKCWLLSQVAFIDVRSGLAFLK